VNIHYAKEPTSNYVRTAVETALAINSQDLPGDILIFLTGQEECERAVAMLEEEDRKGFGGKEGRKKESGERGRLEEEARVLRLAPCALYAGMPAAGQLAAFSPAPRGRRKVVAATNVAETSVTLEGVVFVVDCMHAKQRSYDPATGLESLLVAPISKASAAQRAGRAGEDRGGDPPLFTLIFLMCTLSSCTYRWRSCVWWACMVCCVASRVRSGALESSAREREAL
jgi:ATP-dependent RNA helicase DDX35